MPNGSDLYDDGHDDLIATQVLGHRLNRVERLLELICEKLGIQPPQPTRKKLDEMDEIIEKHFPPKQPPF